ncbi:unnamed protein product [Peronospora belbahrii]|uniref:Histidine ammonia-lyase n=1 Tax=Peronospora belbahrii TaxID=622444 RepID=A0ABN8CML7_9STRA|nr:unnamed protein product [Peronospora belbahrii]
MMHRTEQIVPLSQWRSLWKCSVVNAFHPRIHSARPHTGQMLVASRIRTLLRADNPSELFRSHNYDGKVQDAYTLRCAPQCYRQSDGVHWQWQLPRRVSGYLAIGIHEIASVSERRIERLVNPTLSNLPAFLVSEGGLNSGFMIAHCTAAALVSENKVLTHPSSVDSISTSGSKEDHVSMRKALTVVEHVETVVAIEILAACHALDLLRPLRTTDALEVIHALVRTRVPKFDKDRVMKPDIDAVLDLVRSGAICEVAAPFLTKLHVTEL